MWFSQQSFKPSWIKKWLILGTKRYVIKNALNTRKKIPTVLIILSKQLYIQRKNLQHLW